MKRWIRATLIVVSSLAAIGIEAACSNQGEGEVCSIANGSDDCKTDIGLICYDARQLNNPTSDRCCPSDRSKATHPTCQAAIAIVGDAQAPADTGPAVTIPDAQVTADTGADAGVADATDEQ